VRKKGSLHTVIFYRFLLLMLLYSLCRIGFYLYNIRLFQNTTLEGLARILLGGMKFDLSGLLYLNLLYIFLQIIPLKIRFRKGYQKFCKYLFIITNALGLAANLIDFTYYPYTLRRTTVSVFSEFRHETNKVALFLNFLKDFFPIFIVFAFLVFLLIFLYGKFYIGKPKIKNPIIYYLKESVIMGIIGFLVIIGIRGSIGHSSRPITISNAGEFVKNPEETAIALNTPFSIIRTLKVKPFHKVYYFNESELKEIYNVERYPRPFKAFEKENVIFIILESFGRGHIGALNKDLQNGQYKGFTPFLDSLMSESLVMLDGLANGRRSLEAPPSIIASIPGTIEPFVLSFYSNNTFDSLGKILSKKGYHTSFFHGAPNGSMGFSSFANMAEIQHYYGKTEYNNDKDFDGAWGIWDEEFFQFFADQLNGFQQPFFSTIFSMSSHHPFKIPKRYQGKFPEGPLPLQKCIAYTDYALKRFFEKASKTPWFKNTLFVITADHYSETHLKEYQNAAGRFAVPILFYRPGNSLKGVIKTPVQQIDIMPSVLDLLNYDQPYLAFGESIFKKSPNKFVVNYLNGNYQVFYDQYLLLFNGNKSTGLYDRKNDAQLLKNILDQKPEIQKKIESMAKAFIQQYNNRLIENRLLINK